MIFDFRRDSDSVGVRGIPAVQGGEEAPATYLQRLLFMKI